MDNKMFCYQCQETAGNKGCTQMGVCGKNPEVAGLQDVLVYVSKNLSFRLNEIFLLKQFRIRAFEQFPTHAGAKAVAHVIAQNRGNKQE